MTWLLFLIHLWLVLNSGFCTESNEKTVNKEFLYSTSVQSMVKLLKMENNLMAKLSTYTKLMQKKLDMIKLYQQTLSHPAMGNNDAMEEYVGNSLNAFALLRRLQQDWPKWIEYLTSGETLLQINNMKKQLEKAPTEKDLQKAIVGLLRIESFYDLEASHMAKGWLLKKQYSSNFSPMECVILGDYLYNKTDYSRCAHWYRNALRRYKQPYGQIYGKVLDMNRKKIYRKYAFAIAREVHDGDMPPPDKPEAEWKDMADNLIQELVANASSSAIKRLVDEYLTGDEQIFIKHRAENKPKATVMQKGCRRQWKTPTSNRLSCRYVNDKSAFLKLAPLKAEMLSLQPSIVLYHQVLYDSEIESLKKVASQPTELENESEYHPGSIRLYKLNEFNAPDTLKVNRRIADMLGIAITDQQKLNLINYGLGGYLKREVKQKKQQTKCSSCSLPTNSNNPFTGKRIATMVFYASDVELGGETIFPKLQLLVKPKRSNALLWFHFNEAGEHDALAEHAVCPVVIGSRWAISKCIDVQAQNAKRYCLA